jgi:MYXO-CTERM domain-containing protein
MPLFRRIAFASALSLAVFSSAVAAHAGVPSLGPQFNVGPLDYGPFGSDNLPAVATNGTDFLVAWLGRTVSYTNTVYCARFSGAGALLDKDAIALSLPARGTPSVFWDGTKYLVVSADQGQRIDPATGVADAPLPEWGFDTSSTTYFTGGGDGVFLQVSAIGSYLTASILSASGTFIKRPTLPSFVRPNIAIGYSSGTFLAAWMNGGTVEGVRISNTGVVEDASPILIDAGHASSSATADGGTSTALANIASLQIAGSPSGFLATWSDARNGGDDVYAARVGTDGTVADPGGFLVATNAIDGNPRATWTGTNWWLAWSVQNALTYSVEAASVGTDAAIGAVTPIGDGTRYFPATPALAATATTLFATWQTGQGAILGRRFDLSHAPLDAAGVAVSSHLAQQTGIRLSKSASGFMVSWVEPLLNAAGNIEYAGSAMRLDANGAPLDGALVPIFHNVPGTAFYGGMAGAYAAVYANDGIQIATLAPGASAFTPIAKEPTNTGGFNYEPLAFACMPDRCIVVWYDNNAANTYPAFAAVVMADGTLTPPVSVGSADMATATTDGSSFLVITDGGGPGGAGPVYPIAADGTAGTPLPAQAPGSIAWGGDRYLLLSWATTSNMLERLTAGGALIGAQESAPSFAQTFLRAGAGWDGRAFVVFENQTGVEVPAIAPSTNLTTFPLFAKATTVKVLSVASGSALVLGAEAQGGLGSPRAVVRIMTFPEDSDAGSSSLDGGSDAASHDAGGSDGEAPDAGSDAGHDGGDDAGALDASTGDGGEDAGLPPSHDAGGADAAASADGGTRSIHDAGAADATFAVDSGGPGAPAETGGCGCTTAGTSGGASPFAGLLAIGAAFAVRRRRRARRRFRDARSAAALFGDRGELRAG